MDRRRLIAAVTALGSTLSFTLAPRSALAQFSSETNQYLGAMELLSRMLLWVYDEEARVASEFDTSKLNDDEWIVDYLSPTTVAKAAKEVIVYFDPPPVMQASHDYFVQAIEYLVLAGEESRNGILNNDASALSRAADYIELSNEATRNANNATPSASEIQNAEGTSDRNGESPVETAPDTSQPEAVNLSGEGDRLSASFVLTPGRYRVSASAHITANVDGFSVTLINPDGSSDLLFNEFIDRPQEWTGSHLLTIDTAGQYFVEVSNSNSPWEISIEPVT